MYTLVNTQKEWYQSIQKYTSVLIIVLCFLSVLLLPFKPNIASKIFNFSGIISLSIILTAPKKYLINKVIIIAIPLFLIGVSNLLWYQIYKTEYITYINAYHNTLQIGKITIFGSFILLIISNKYYEIINKFHIYLAIVMPILILFYSFYQILYQGINRVELSFENSSNATGAAYAINFLALYTQMIILQSKIKYKYYLALILTAIYLISIILTQTRSVILTFPIITLLVLFIFLKQNSKLDKKLVLISFSIILSCFIFFKDNIMERMENARSEITSYICNNKMSSTGDRLSMLKAGFFVSKDNLFWQSVEERNNKIILLARKDDSFIGATSHMHAHLHNDIIEALSTKGWLDGVLLIFSLYCSIIIYAIKNNKDIFLLGFVSTFFILGLSDTLIYATQIPLSWMLILILMLNYIHYKNNNLPKKVK